MSDFNYSFCLKKLVACGHVSETERIWAGVKTVNYEAQPTAKGSLCYYKSREGEDKWRESQTFR